MQQQRHLFSMPGPAVIALTEVQQGVLDWVAYNEGKLAAWPVGWPKLTLRLLIKNQPGLLRRCDRALAELYRRQGQAGQWWPGWCPQAANCCGIVTSVEAMRVMFALAGGVSAKPALIRACLREARLYAQALMKKPRRKAGAR